MLLVNDALFVAGGRNTMVFNVSSREAILQQRDDAVVAAADQILLARGLGRTRLVSGHQVEIMRRRKYPVSMSSLGGKVLCHHTGRLRKTHT